MAFDSLSNRLSLAFKNIAGNGKLTENNKIAIDLGKKLLQKGDKLTLEDTKSYLEKFFKDNSIDNAKIEDISVGMQQRVEILKALYRGAEILILDEPMNGLDEQMVEKIRGVVLELKKRGKLIIITSHNREDIDVLCDHVWEMDKGVAKQVR